MKRITKNKEIKLTKLAEELMWLLEAHKDTSLKDLCAYVIQSNGENTNRGLKTNTAYLVGVLPNLLQDKDLFVNTSEMIDFANSVLGLSISTSGNRSRMEYIGMIVCDVSNKDSSQLDSLVEALDKLIGNESKMQKVKQSKLLPNFSWNKIISELNTMG